MTENVTTTTWQEPNGALLRCWEGTTIKEHLDQTICLWVRSGSGIALTIEFGVRADVVASDTRVAVADLARS